VLNSSPREHLGGPVLQGLPRSGLRTLQPPEYPASAVTTYQPQRGLEPSGTQKVPGPQRVPVAPVEPLEPPGTQWKKFSTTVKLQKVLEARRLPQPSTVPCGHVSNYVASGESLPYYSIIVLVVESSGTSFQSFHSL